MKELIERLHREQCSLVIRSSDGAVTTYNKKGVRDLDDLLHHSPTLLQGAWLADKVIGKAAAGMMACGGVERVWADVMSRKAVPVLQRAGIAYDCATLVDGIVIPEGDDRCPLEQIVEPYDTPTDILHALREHFQEMQRQREQAGK